MNDESVILVNDKDEQIGTMEKLKAHELGCLHRAISVFVFNSNGKLLLQRRALDKYHSAGLWSNTCCSHPRPGESVLAAANRRLKEEMGIRCELQYSFSFVYKVEFANSLTENEFDHSFVGISDDTPLINREEVAEYCYLSLSEIKADLSENPDKYTEWFKIIMERDYLAKNLSL